MRHLAIDKATYAAMKRIPSQPAFTPDPVIDLPEYKDQMELFDDTPAINALKPFAKASICVGRKRRDTTKLTQEDHDKVCELWEERTKYNMADHLEGRYDTKMLTERLNVVLGYNKSVAVYSKIWRGVVTRESLPSKAELIEREAQK